MGEEVFPDEVSCIQDSVYLSNPKKPKTTTVEGGSPVEADKSLSKQQSCSPVPSTLADFARLNLPAAEGWQREVVIRQGVVAWVYYLTPPDKQGNRRRVKNLKPCMEEVGSTSLLRSSNFCFSKQVLGLQEGFEICRENLLPGYSGGHSSIYSSFFKPSEVGVKEGKRFVECTLCGHTSSFTNISTHMKKYHLPDETCLVCSQELSPIKMPAHLKICRKRQIL